MEKNRISLYEQPEDPVIRWDYTADVVVVGSGGAGLPAALKAQEEGTSVLIVEANWDVGGHAAVSGGNLHSGAGTEIQRRFGIEDSPDLYYTDHTVGDIVATRYNERAYVRAVADAMAEAYEFIQKKGVRIQEKKPTRVRYYKDPEGGSEPESVPRWTVADNTAEEFRCFFDGHCRGVAFTRPLERTFRQNGGRILLNYHMDMLYRERQLSGRVLGLRARYTPTVLPGETEPLESLWSENSIRSVAPEVNIRARRAVVLATGGSSGNVRFRTMIDPRLGPEFDGIAGMPFSDQDASGELAAMAIGASLGGLAQYTQRGGQQLAMPTRLGCRYGYRSYGVNSPIFKLFRVTGIPADYRSVILVNMLGQRFANEDVCVGSKHSDDVFDFYDAAFSSVLAPDENGVLTRYGGPIWAIFDQGAVERNGWDMGPEGVDWADGRCFRGDTPEELAERVVNKYYEHVRMDPRVLAETVAAFNAAVDAGEDAAFGRKRLEHRLDRGPFYAAWAMPVLHDTYGGLRCTPEMQVVDLCGEAIPGLFAAGESSGGMRIHGFGRVITSGYIAGKYAAAAGAKK